jgi:hypothetical protein
MSDDTVPEGHTALQSCKQGKLGGREAIGKIVAGTLWVPMHEPPALEDGRITRWRPSNASKPDGSQWLIAFTCDALATAWCHRNPDQATCMAVDTRWVLALLPKEWGIVFNLHTEDMLEWSASGRAKYEKDVLRW